MKISISLQLSLLFSLLLVVTINAQQDLEVTYMSQLLKALTPTPSGWSNNTHHCNWTGIGCDQSSQVVAIKLPSSSLTGTLPQNLYSLSSLTHLDLHNNSLTGPLPSMSALFALKTVYLGHNNFTSIPNHCFQLLTVMQTLNLSNNLKLMPWIFPKDLIDSKVMHTLDLEATNIIGSLPSDMFDWFPHLHTVFLSHNDITGTLPRSLENSVVRYLRLNNQGRTNGFEGTIEVISSMGFLSQAWLNNNAFTGPIPNLSNSTHLFDLQLHSNFLQGLVPPSLFSLSSLTNISLDSNNFQGPIPMFHKGVKATWKGNNFCSSNVGPCDPQVMVVLAIFAALGYPEFGYINNNDICNNGGLITCQKGKIVSVDFRGRQVSGTISPAFSNLTSLVNLTLADNNLTGSIPKNLATLPLLKFLDVSDNNLSGQVPKFPSKVNLITRGNAFQKLNVSRQGGGEDAAASRDGGPFKSKVFIALAITGMYVYPLYISILLCFRCNVAH